MMHKNGYPAVEVSNLWKSFGSQEVLCGVDLTIRRGETLVVLGRSGTGKSVLLKIIVGLQKPDSGSVRIDGEEITEISLKKLNEVRKKIGFLFQYSALFDSMTVEENVAFALRRHSRMHEADIQERVHELLSRVAVDDSAAKLPGKISGGMRKRVALARALALFPQLLLCDEPTAGLDPITAGEINMLINNLQDKYQMSSMIVTHDLSSARMISDRVAMLDKGCFIFDGTFDQLVNSDNELVRTFMQPVLMEAR